MVSSITPSTLRQYNSSLKRWWFHCLRNGIEMFEFNVPAILEFLTGLFDSGAAYGTLNSTRSALALITSPDVGTDFRIKRFFKGVERLKPGRPKYDVTWDPQIVLKHLTTLKNEEITLELLAKKLATLLALTTAHRVQTLSLVDITNLEFLSASIRIKITERIKTSRRNAPQPVLILPYFRENPQICVATVLKTYLDRTKKLRGSCNNLFLTIKKPFRAASAQTLSRWIKNMLGESGIDTSIFSAHSTRHASTSAAERNGVSLDLIRKTAGWSDKSQTFALFYKRPLQTSEFFANAILI